MHIVEFPSIFPPYGGEFTIDQAKALSDMGHRVHILCVNQMSVRKHPRMFLSGGFSVRRTTVRGVPLWMRTMHGLPLVVRPVEVAQMNARRWISLAVSMVGRYIEECGRPDVLHAQCCEWAGRAAMIASRRWNIPYVITEHSPRALFDKELTLCGGSSPWQLPLLREAYENAALVMPVSAHLVDDLAGLFGRDYRWSEQPNMIDTEAFKFSPPQRRDRIDILCAANFTHIKGQDILLPAFAEAQRAAGVSLALHLAGRDTQSDECRRLCAESGAKNVTCHGMLSREGLSDLMRRCDALVLPSRDEVQPLCVLEALCSGRPAVVTQSTPFQGDVIESGLLRSDFNDPASMTAAILRLPEFLERYDARSVADYVGRTCSPMSIAQQITAQLTAVGINGISK